MVDLDEKITQAEFAAMVKISQQAVSDLIAREVIQRSDTAAKWLHDYCEHLREVAAGRQSSVADGLDLVQERARLAKEQADSFAMKNAITRREYAPLIALEFAVADAGRQIAQILESIPVKLKRRCQNLTGTDIEFIQEQIVQARNIAAAITVDLDKFYGDTADTSDADARAENARSTNAETA